MALHFVSTSVLSSDDGIAFSKETALESDEARKVRLEKERAAQKPLYQQLAEQNERKQEEYDKISKLLFGAPRGLDDEDYAFVTALEETKNAHRARLLAEEESDVAEFKRSLAHVRAPLLDESSLEPPLNSLAASNHLIKANVAPPLLPIITGKR
jgi:hypothetical protein